MFSKIIILLFTILLVLCFTLNVLADPPCDDKKEWMTAMEKCKGESTPDEVKSAFESKEFPESMNCYVGCLSMETKWLTPEGEFNQAHADEVLEKCPEFKTDEKKEHIEKTKAALGDTKDKCEAGKKLIPLINEMMKKEMPQ